MLIDTIVRLEVTDEDVGKALELHVAEIEFYDQLGGKGASGGGGGGVVVESCLAGLGALSSP